MLILRIVTGQLLILIALFAILRFRVSLLAVLSLLALLTILRRALALIAVLLTALLIARTLLAVLAALRIILPLLRAIVCKLTTASRSHAIRVHFATGARQPIRFTRARSKIPQLIRPARCAHPCRAIGSTRREFALHLLR